MRSPRHGPGLREVAALWALYLLVAAEVFATYARLPVRELYHVSENGRAGGAGRALVFLNWPVALAAIPFVAIVAARARSRAVTRLAIVAVVLCAAVFWPGTVDQVDLDVKWQNAIAAVGVLLAFGLTVVTLVRRGLGVPTRARGDRLRALIAVLLLVIALPWIAADLGFFILGSDRWYAGFGHARLGRAVHLGNHHGMVGTLLALTAIVLSRVLGRLPPRLRLALAAYLSILLLYGLANVANDFWLEQLVKRGVTDWQIPSMIVPAPNLPWLVLVVLAALVYVFVFRRIGAAEPLGPRRVGWAAVLLPAVVALLAIGLAHGPTRHITPRGRADGIAFAYAPKGTAHIFVTREGGLVQLTDSDGSELAPAWSPDHRRIAFQSNRDGNWEIYVANADGSDARRLTDDDAEDGEPAWPPDGQHILFVRGGDLYSMRLDGRGLRMISDDPRWPRATLSPTGKRFVEQCLDHDHWHICVDGQPVTRGDRNDFAPTWSPDGRRIALISDRDGRDQLFVMRVDGTDVVRITSGQGDKDTPAWGR